MTTATSERFLESGSEAGTAPGDRKFRPDVQGLRAVAILLVVLFHAGVPGITGGFVGVDVFFVISGFVITGVLLREFGPTGGTSILSFYARRARRIIPAATLVIVATVLVASQLLGPAAVNQTAVDGQWASVFLANFHFAAAGTNYLASQQPPSPLQNFWSLAVEEQFYLVYPTVFFLVASLRRWFSLRARLAVLLVVTIVASYTLSIVMTSSNASSAFFSPFTRAWELALGALVLVGTDQLRRMPVWAATAASWVGIAMILVGALAFTSATRYPGSLVAVPVVGTALVIGAGAAQPAWGAEALLRRRPFLLLGLVSYSLYLWHWPVLIIASDRQGSTSLPVAENLLWILFSLLLAIGTYAFIENPIRHAHLMTARRWASVGIGACLVVFSLAVATYEARQSRVASASALARAVSGTVCPAPTPAEIAAMRKALGAGTSPTTAPPSGPLRVLVAGDSTACTMLPGLAALGPTYGVQFEDAAVVGCGIVSGRLAPLYRFGVDRAQYTSICQRKALATESAALHRDKPQLVLWSSAYERESILVPTATGTKVLVKGTRQWTEVMQQRVERRLRLLVGSGAKVMIALQPPPVDAGKPAGPTETDSDSARLDTLLRQAAARFPGQVEVVDLGARVCPSGPPCPNRIAGLIVRPDTQHYGTLGSLWVGGWLMPKILTFAGSK